MISLGGVALNPNMVWEERFQSHSVAQSVKRTLGGIAVVFAVPVVSGQSITLVAGEEYGWLSYTVVQDILTMASVVGGLFTLIYGGREIQVMFRHNESPAVELHPFVPRVEHESSDIFIGKIKLLVV